MWGRDFDWYHFRTQVHPNPRIGGAGDQIGGSQLDIGTVVKWQQMQIEQKFLLTGIGKTWVGLLSIRANLNPLTFS